MNIFQVVSTIVLLTYCCAFAVNGIAVSAVCRNSSNSALVPELFAGNPTQAELSGILVKWTIENSRVVRTDTIYKETWMRYPAFSFKGDRIAFFRFESKTVNGQILLAQGDMFLSVINTDGSGLRDVVVFRREKGVNFNINVLDWPQGEWLYYIEPLAGFERQVWRVHSADTTRKEKVHSYARWDAGKWSISLDKTRAAVVTALCTPFNDPLAGGKSKDWCVTPHTFPPSSGTDRGSFDYDCFAGCMAQISPGGNHVFHFFGRSHTSFKVNKWAPPYTCISTTEISTKEVDKMVNDPSGSIGSTNFEGRFSVNSDKWICLESGGAKWAGSSHILVNWVDGEAIGTAKNLPAENGVYLRHTSGDFYVSGRDGELETVEGVWEKLRPSDVSNQIPKQMQVRKTNAAVTSTRLLNFTAGHKNIFIKVEKTGKMYFIDIRGQVRRQPAINYK